jgi:hypothetical protein
LPFFIKNILAIKLCFLVATLVLGALLSLLDAKTISENERVEELSGLVDVVPPFLLTSKMSDTTKESRYRRRPTWCGKSRKHQSY